MALGLHWEWRGFGAVSSNFVHRYCKLDLAFPEYPDPQEVKDVYMWISGLELNIKVRDISTEPFKIKRIQGKDGSLEKWAENKSDIYEFPLNEAGWEALAESMATVELKLGPYPSGEVDAKTTLSRLKEAGARTINVNKLRESVLWQGPNAKVKVEWACISFPQSIISIGLENWYEEPEDQSLSDKQAKEDIWAAVKELGLDSEPLKVMNYVEAVTVWAEDKKL